MIKLSHHIGAYISLIFYMGCGLLSPLWAQGAVGSETGLPLPRFVSIKSTEVNMRTGPGTRYPIRWVYQRQSLPMEVANEFGHWREVRDYEGVKGWIHKSMLSGQRTVIIDVKKNQILHAKPDVESAAMLVAEPEVVAPVVQCAASWCELQIAGRKGWMPKEVLWGIKSNEIID